MNLPTNRINTNTSNNNRNSSRKQAQTSGTSMARGNGRMNQPLRGNMPASLNRLNNFNTPQPVASLTEGQVIRGEITDLRNNAVLVTLEDNTTVTAHLEQGTSLSIGDVASFRVEALSSNQIILKALPQNTAALTNHVIYKALEAAQLPKNEKNQTIVSELMNHQLPINKQAITKILQQSFLNKDIEISTLVIMNKYHIPITKENAMQFENYRSQNHQLTNQLLDLGDILPQQLKDISYHSANTNLSQFTSSFLDILMSPNTNFTAAPATSNLPLTFTPEEQANLLEILETIDTPQNLIESFKNTTLPLEKLMQSIHSAMESAIQLDNQNLMENGLSEKIVTDLEGNFFFETTNMSDNPSDLPNVQRIPLDNYVLKDPTTQEPIDILLRSETFHQPIIQKLEESFHLTQLEKNEVGAFLNSSERQELLDFFAAFPINEDFKGNIQKGTASLDELLQIIKNVTSFAPKESLSSLLESDAFSILAREKFYQNFFLTPRKLKSPNSVEHYYETLQSKLSDLKELFAFHSQTSDVISKLVDSSQNETNESLNKIHDNLDFMKILNQMFTYVQLPTRLKQEFTHADLYVYTKKKELQKEKKNISVLLHLDLTHLGPLDIHINLTQQQVHSKFYFSNKAAQQLFATNIQWLEETLVEKGYLLTSEFFQREKEIDIVKDFIAQDSGDGKPLRYTFDIRA